VNRGKERKRSKVEFGNLGTNEVQGKKITRKK
jgi:hypothetical protein